MYKKLCFLICSVLCLEACDDDKKKPKDTNIAAHVGDLSFDSMDAPGEFQSTFPLSEHVHYISESAINHPVSISLDFPLGYVIDLNNRLGHIDASQELLPYEALEISDIDDAVDFDVFEQTLWYVDDTHTVHLVSNFSAQQGGELNAWSLSGKSFNEITVNHESRDAWLLEANEQRIYQLNTVNKSWRYWNLPSDIEVIDIDFLDETLRISFRKETTYFLKAYNVIRGNLVDAQLWVMENDQSRQFTEIKTLPDGQLLVAFEGDTENLDLYQEVLDIEDSPIEPSKSLALLESHTLPDGIAQPSGIAGFSDGRWVMVTDQSELYVLSDNFSEILFSEQINIPGVACNQGCIEGVAVKNDYQVYVITDNADLAELSILDSGLVYESQGKIMPSQTSMADNPSFAGVAYDIVNDSIFALTNSRDEDETDILFGVSPSSNYTTELEATVYHESNININSYEAEGLALSGDRLFALSDVYKQVLVINTSGEILDTLKFESDQIFDASDLFVDGNLIYLIGDHESDEPTPPVEVYQLF